MDKVASLNNDTAKTKFTYTNMLPYLQLAYQVLAEEAELNDIPIVNETDDLVVTTAMTDIGGSTGPALPTDLVEIRSLWERLNGTADDFIPINRLNYLPPTQVKGNALEVWAWQNQIVKFLGANTDRQVRMNYLGNTIGSISSASDSISMINAASYLEFATAGLCAAFIGENPTRAQQLASLASDALDRLVGLSAKGAQGVVIRRRPFRAAFKTRGL